MQTAQVPSQVQSIASFVPKSDPQGSLAEIERRRKLVADTTAAATSTADASVEQERQRRAAAAAEDAVRRKEMYLAEYPGFWVIKVANARTQIQCVKPNLLMGQCYRTVREAAAAVKAIMHHPTQKTAPGIVPAGEAFQIPYSEELARNPDHVRPKIARNIDRYLKRRQHSDAEFERRQASVVEHEVKAHIDPSVTPYEAPTEKSAYHVQQMYLTEQRRLKNEQLLRRRKKNADSGVEERKGNDDDGDAQRNDDLREEDNDDDDDEVDAAEVALQAVPLPTVEQIPALPPSILTKEETAKLLPLLGGMAPSLSTQKRDSAATAAIEAARASSVTDICQNIAARIELERQVLAAKRAADTAVASNATASPPADSLDAIPIVGEEAVFVSTGGLAVHDVAASGRVGNDTVVPPAGGALAPHVSASVKKFFEVQAPLLRADELPAHWRQPQVEPTSKVGSSVVIRSTAAQKVRVNADDDYPREFEHRSRRFGVLAMIPDEDRPEDTPYCPEAAGHEPVFILFPNMFETVDAAQQFTERHTKDIAPDLTLDVVELYGWLWPTEINTDKIPEKHYAKNPDMDPEYNKVMSCRKTLIQTAQDARAAAKREGFVMPEVTVDKDSIPTLEADGTSAPAKIQPMPNVMRLTSLEQFDAAGNAIAAAPYEIPAPADHTSAIEILD
jgi:hypothetical protein